MFIVQSFSTTDELATTVAVADRAEASLLPKAGKQLAAQILESLVTAGSIRSKNFPSRKRAQHLNKNGETALASKGRGKCRISWF